MAPAHAHCLGSLDVGEDGRDSSELDADEVAQRLRELSGELVVLEDVEGAENARDNALSHERVVRVTEELALRESSQAHTKQQRGGGAEVSQTFRSNFFSR